MNIKKLLVDAEKEYKNKNQKSEKEYLKAKQLMPGGVTRFTNYYFPYPITVVRGEGAKLYDIDGNTYIDFVNNYGSLIHGHAHPIIVQKVKDAVERGSAIAASIPEHIQLAEILCDRVPSIEQIRFCNSGTEATMFAIRAARAYTGRPGIIKMEGGYHGLHDTVEHSVHPPFNNEKNRTLPPVPDSIGISENVSKDVYIAPFNNIEAVEKILMEHSEKIAAIIVEPVMGTAGTIIPQDEYLISLRKVADKYDVLLIFDEVLTFRLGYRGAQGVYNVTPDLTALGKIIGGGFPVGAFGGRTEIMSLFDPIRKNNVSHGGTFSGNNITMTAGIAALELYDQDSIERLEALSLRLEEGLLKAIKDFDISASITRAGSMITIHYMNEKPINYAMKSKSNKEMAKYVHLELMNKGIFIAPRGTWYLSTAMENSHIETTIQSFREVMKKLSFVEN